MLSVSKFARMGARTCLNRAALLGRSLSAETVLVPAQSLGSAWARRETLTMLSLVASPDLRCTNIMCGGCGGPCVCRLSASLEKLPLLQVLDLSFNGLVALPASVWVLPQLRSLCLRGNALRGSALTSAGTPVGAASVSLRELDLRCNPIAAAAELAPLLSRLPSLRLLRIGGCPLAANAADLAALRALIPPYLALDVRNEGEEAAPAESPSPVPEFAAAAAAAAR